METTKNEKKEKRGFWDFAYEYPFTTLGLAWTASNLILGVVQVICGKND